MMTSAGLFSRSLFAMGLFCAALAPLPILAQIAPGVTQSAAHTANVTGTVTDSNGKPVAGADVRLSGLSLLSTKTDVRGTFAFRSVPWGTYQIAVSSSIGAAIRDNVAINRDISVAIQFQAKSSGLKTIAEVSTAGAGAHINVTSSSVTSVSPRDYAFQGNTTWTGLFAQVPGVAVSGNTLGGFGNTAIAGWPFAPVVLSLNGSLPYETSTTIDGMPFQNISFSIYPGAGVDLSSLPLNAFATSDIVRGEGANAPSIVDSIGGSLVLHPPEEVDKDHFDFSVSNDAYGGTSSNAELAFRRGRLSTTLIYGLYDSPGPLGTQNVISSGAASPSTIGGQVVQAPTNAVNANGFGVPNCNCTYTNSLLYCCVQASSGWTSHDGAIALSYRIGSSIIAQVFYAGSTKNGDYLEGYYPTIFAPGQANPGYSGSIAPSPPNTPSYNYLGYLFPWALTVSNSLLEEKITAYVGHGVLRLEALQNYGYLSGGGNLNQPPNGTYRVWGTANVGPSSPGVSTAYNGSLEDLAFLPLIYSTSSNPNARALLGSYTLQLAPSLSAGLSYLTSFYNQTGNQTITYAGTPISTNTSDPATSQTTNETRLHLESDISDKLSLGLSWYFANANFHVPVPTNQAAWTNSNFSYNAPRLGAVWRANENIAVRAAAGGGFSLPQLTFLTQFSLQQSGNGYVEGVPNLNLKPEESFGYDIGTDIRLKRNTTLSFDLYNTRLYGMFFQNVSVSTYNGAPLYIYEYGNLGSGVNEGLNLDIRHDVPSGYYWQATLGFSRGFVASVPAGFYSDPSVPCNNCRNQYVVLGTNFNSAAYSGGVPYASASGLLGYRWTPDRYVDLLATYYGSNNIYYTPKAFIELDANAGYSLTKNLSLLLTFKNVTGVYDQSIQTYNPSYAVPVIPGAPPNSQGAGFVVPYGPRSLIVTFRFRSDI